MLGELENSKLKACCWIWPAELVNLEEDGSGECIVFSLEELWRGFYNKSQNYK